MSDFPPKIILDRYRFLQEDKLLEALHEAANYNDNLQNLEDALIRVFSLAGKMTGKQWYCFNSQRKNRELLRLAMHRCANVDISKCPMIKFDEVNEKQENIFASLGQGYLIRLFHPSSTIEEYFTDPDFRQAIEKKAISEDLKIVRYWYGLEEFEREKYLQYFDSIKEEIIKVREVLRLLPKEKQQTQADALGWKRTKFTDFLKANNLQKKNR